MSEGSHKKDVPKPEQKLPDVFELREELPSDLSAPEPTEENFEKMAERYDWQEELAYQMRLAFHEILVNAIVHGNLEIYTKDTAERNELIRERMRDPNYNDRKVYIFISISKNKIEIRVEDEGPGFDWQVEAQKKIDPLDVTGRGSHYFVQQGFPGPDGVVYSGRGNVVDLCRQRE